MTNDLVKSIYGEKMLSQLSMAQLVEAFNLAASFTDLAPVKRFADRKSAIRRVKAIADHAAAQGPRQTGDLDSFFSSCCLDAAEEKPVTHIDPALARGAEGKVSTHCRKSLSDQKASQPKAEPEVTDAKVKKALKKASPRRNVRSPMERSLDKAIAAKNARQKSTGAKLVLKANKEVRALLTKAAQAAGGTRLTPIGFKDYSAFLNGVPLDKDGNAEVAFVPVKGNAPIQGKNVKLTIRAGKVLKVK